MSDTACHIVGSKWIQAMVLLVLQEDTLMYSKVGSSPRVRVLMSRKPKNHLDNTQYESKNAFCLCYKQTPKA